LVTDLLGDKVKRFQEKVVSRAIGSFAKPIVSTPFVALLFLLPVAAAFISLGSAPALSPAPGEGQELRAITMATGTPPRFWYIPSSVSASAGIEATFYVVVGDVDNDMINVTWDYGDGTPNGHNTTGPAAAPTIVYTSHTWNPVSEPGQGDYTVYFTINITLDDGNGNIVTGSTTAGVLMPPNIPPKIYLSGPAKTFVGDNVTLVSNATDPEGDPLTWTYVFNDSVSDYLTIVNYTDRTPPSTTVWNNLTVVFSALGYYNITLNVSDALPPYQVFPHNVSLTIKIQVVPNNPPNATDIISVSPANPIINATSGYVTVNYTVEVSDMDGDRINVTWDFGGGEPLAYNETDGGVFVYAVTQERNYTDAGTYNISVVITDGRPGHAIYLNQSVNITSTNRPPSVVNFNFTYVTGNFALPNETVNFTLVIMDPEKNPVEVIVDFGDNSTRLYFNLTDFIDYNVTLTFNHSYPMVGKYVVTVWYTDNKIGVFNHSKMYNVTVTVKIPAIVIHANWDWWDYTSLGLFCLIPVLFAARFFQVARKRKQLELEGMTLEEFKLMRSEMGEKAKKGGEGGA